MNKNNIDWIAMKLNDWPGKIATLTGYADVRGTEEYNLALSQRRANAVQEQLLLRGVNPDQIKVEAKGKHYPLTRKEDEQERNRRVDVTFAYPQNKFEATLSGWWDAMFGGDEEPQEAEEDLTIEEAPAKAEEVKAEAKAKVEAVKADANNVKQDVKNDATAVKADAKENVKEIKNDVQTDVKSVKEDVKQDANKVQP